MAPSAAGAGDRWPEIWARRRLDQSNASVVAQLLAADGFDTGFGDIDASRWGEYVRGWADRFGLGPGSSVFEVGCGAGAFLYELERLGCSVAGLDQSEALVEIARTVIPAGDFTVAGADELATEPSAEAVVSFSVFYYLPSLAYARSVIRRMVARSDRIVAVFDLPDAACRDAALADRIETAGGPEAYAEGYAGLDHLYYRREWVRDELRAGGLEGVTVEDQSLPGYQNGRFRFNAWGFVPALP